MRVGLWEEVGKEEKGEVKVEAKVGARNGEKKK